MNAPYPYSWLLSFFEQGGQNVLDAKLAELAPRSDLDLEAAKLEQLVGLLDGLGLSVERTFELPAVPEGVVVAEIVSVTKVEGSDHLLLTELEAGSGRVQVVTAAPNVAVGMRTALALPGAVLPAVGLEVAEREVAGVRSEGVLCTPRELGLYDYGGLTVFGDDAPVGGQLGELWAAETVIELELTPNRADAFSLLGVARDLAAKLDLSFRHPADGLDPGDPDVDDGLSVRLDDLQGCPRMVLKRIDGLTVGPSPVWLQRRLAALGLRPRNNLVDVTNYVTFELGQPSHAFDLNDLRSGELVVRRAAAGEKLTVLNEQHVTLSEADLVITVLDGETTKPIDIAGVIGGLHYSVKETTRSVALGVSHFEPVSIRKTAKRHGLSTDAHTRFERGVDPNLPPLAAARAAQLIAELGGGTVHPGLTEVGGDVTRGATRFRPSRVAFLTTLEVSLEEQERYLTALGCTVRREGDDAWTVTPPSWRFDLSAEPDLIEEVARLHGYEHIGVSVPTMAFVPTGADTTHRGLRNLLVGFGLQETLTYTFSSDEALARSRAPAASVRLSSPPSQERSVLRTALYPGLLEAARANRGDRAAFFEIGRVFGGEEEERLGILVRGAWAGGGWLPEQKADFYVFKGLLEKLAATLGVGVALGAETYPALHPGVSARVVWDGRPVGLAGRLHPAVAADLELGETYLAELTLPLPGRSGLFAEFSRQPFAERDLAVVAPSGVLYAELAALATGAAGERLESVSPFDVYEGPPVPAGSRSVALRLRFRDPARALRDDEVERYMSDVIAAFAEQGYDIRSR